MNELPEYKANRLDVELTFDDVLLPPQKSGVKSRSDVDTSMNITPSIEVEIPIISSNMDTVTGAEMAQAMSDVGACGITHRFDGAEAQAEMIRQVDGVVGATLGVSDNVVEDAHLYLDAGADFLCVDTPHAHADHVVSSDSDDTDVSHSNHMSVIEKLRNEFPDVDIMAGNVASRKGAIDLINAGANSIKVGIGSGSVCETRLVTGAGRPQFTSVGEVSRGVREYLNFNGQDLDEVTVIADGGIRNSGDMMKSLMVGADAVMVGGFVAGCPESLKGVEYRGMASAAAREDRSDNSSEEKNIENPEERSRQAATEGARTNVEEQKSVKEVILEAQGGIQSGCSYCGGGSIKEARKNAEFVRTTTNTVARNGVHGNKEVLEKSQE